MTELTGNKQFNWRRLYAVATLAGAALGILLALGALPALPDQLTTWMHSLDDEVSLLVPVLGGAAVGLALAAVAHLGVRWQLRQRSKADLA